MRARSRAFGKRRRWRLCSGDSVGFGEGWGDGAWLKGFVAGGGWYIRIYGERFGLRRFHTGV